MSLIEKAAKRLEELQRAEALLAEGSNPLLTTEGATSTGARIPIPEAIMRASAEAAGSTASAYFRTTEPRKTEPAPVKQPVHKVEISFARLAQRNYVTPDDPHSAIAHEFRSLKRPLIRNANGADGAKISQGNFIVVTSSIPGEGKTFVATNLAISIAMEVDRTVMLVDGDVARSSLPAVLDIPPSPGLLDLLVSDDLDINDVLLQTNIPGLTILPAGRPDRRATELLASEKMASLLRQLAKHYPDRIIVFDSPPLLPTTEAPVLARHMGQVVMVVAADVTPRHVVRQALALIEDCEVVLMLLNKTTKSMAGTYYGYY